MQAIIYQPLRGEWWVGKYETIWGTSQGTSMADVDPPARDEHPNAPSTEALAARLRAETNAVLAAIVASSDDAIISKTLDGIIRTWNAGAERIFGYTADEMIGKSMETLMPPERRGEEAEILRRLRNGERVDHFETIRVR